MQLSKDVSEFVRLMKKERVEFVVVGAWALAYHGRPRYTGDIDFLVRKTRDNAERILRVIDEFGLGSLDVTVSDLTKDEQVIQFGMPPNRIDLVTDISGVTFDEVWETRVTDDIGDIQVDIIARELLIKNKRASGRAKDLADVESLES
jgi:hypothetical protein